MAWKYKDEFLKDWGNQKGEPKNHYDIYDYMHWLEDKLNDVSKQVKNIACEPVLSVGVSNDAMGDAAKDFTDNNTDFTKLGIYTAYYNGARWMRDRMSDTNA